MAYWVVVGCAIAALASRIETELSCTSCVCYSYYYTNFHHSHVLANEVTNGGIYHSCQSSCIFQGNYLFSSISASVIVLLVRVFDIKSVMSYQYWVMMALFTTVCSEASYEINMVSCPLH